VGVFDVAAIPGGFVAVGRSSEESRNTLRARRRDRSARRPRLSIDLRRDRTSERVQGLVSRRVRCLGGGRRLSSSSCSSGVIALSLCLCPPQRQGAFKKAARRLRKIRHGSFSRRLGVAPEPVSSAVTSLSRTYTMATSCDGRRGQPRGASVGLTVRRDQALATAKLEPKLELSQPADQKLKRAPPFTVAA
jgi:hypothetical protein